MTLGSKTAKSSILALAAVGLAAGSALAAPAPGAGDPARGKVLYHEHGCYGCHGFQGQTGARNLVGTNSPLIATPETFILFLRQRGDFLPMIPSTRMPAFPATAVSDQQAMDIFAYIKTFKLDAPDVKTIPVFDKIQASAAAPYKPAK
jgi:mono/diheme cytochrome c family protein